jgi:hypothetical protein
VLSPSTLISRNFSFFFTFSVIIRYIKNFLEVFVASRSIVDEDVVPVKGEVSLEEVAEMLFLVFAAVKDLEEKVDEFIASGRGAA